MFLKTHPLEQFENVNFFIFSSRQFYFLFIYFKHTLKWDIFRLAKCPLFLYNHTSLFFLFEDLGCHGVFELVFVLPLKCNDKMGGV